MPVHPLSIGAVTVEHQCQNGTLRTLVLVLSERRLEPTDANLTREGVDLKRPDGLGDAVAAQVDADHAVSVLCVYCTMEGATPHRPLRKSAIASSYSS